MCLRSIVTCAALGVGLTAVPALAQDTGNTILVLDGSGSMWGQIDGVAKITIAQDVVGGLLQTLPEDQALGLTVYGHRERGNCADIETIAAPGTATRAEIAAAVNGIKPKGKTPMTDAVRQAAEALRYTEEKATVILVSDGIETCDPDPCAAARVLEEAGIDFTAHVIGFDISDPEALRQMQCLAEETGGTFTTADNAAELATALTTVAAAPEPEPAPVPVPIRFEAVIGAETGPVITDPVLWEVVAEDGTTVTPDMTNPAELPLLPGSYRVTATWTVQEVSQTRQFIAPDTPRTVPVVFEKPKLTATLTAPAQAPFGATIEVGWTGPAGPEDYIGVGMAEATGAARWRNFAYAEGEIVRLLMPPVEGPAVISYFDGATREVLGSTEIILTRPPIDLTGPGSAVAGSTIEVGWRGPDYADDFVAVGQVGATGAARWESYALTAGGTPLSLTLPSEPGEYHLTYFLGQDNTQVHQIALTITEAVSSLTAPSEAVAGSTIEVGWQGPGYDDDYIGIGKPGATGSGQWETFAYVKDGNPLSLSVPTEPGAYQLTYFIGNDRTALTRVALTVTEATAGVTAPSEAAAGSTIEVGWTGPGYKNDYIGIGAEEATGSGRWKTFAYVQDGNPLRVRVPIDPGAYVIRYFLNQDRTEIASAPLTVTALDVQISAPATAEAGAMIDVDWQGPGYKDDYIGVGSPGATGSGRWQTFAYVRDGTPLTLRVPPEPGDYVVTYFANQDRTALSSVPITLTPVAASITAPSSAPAGGEIEIGWTGPAHDGDFIGIGLEGATSSGQWKRYVLVRDGNPVRLPLPEEPGAYVIKYFLDQDNTPVATAPITLE